LVRRHPTQDVVAVPLFVNHGSDFGWIVGVTGSLAASGLVQVPASAARKYADVSIGNECVLFGYPSSLGLGNIPQVDPSKALLRTGIIAGKNDALRTLVLDVTVHPGNSGGPVLQIDDEGVQWHYSVIGVLTQAVPAQEKWPRQKLLVNSGYAIAAPMDCVLELVATLEPAP
jgi:hypothetical protein